MGKPPEPIPSRVTVRNLERRPPHLLGAPASGPQGHKPLPPHYLPVVRKPLVNPNRLLTKWCFTCPGPATRDSDIGSVAGYKISSSRSAARGAGGAMASQYCGRRLSPSNFHNPLRSSAARSARIRSSFKQTSNCRRATSVCAYFFLRSSSARANSTACIEAHCGSLHPIICMSAGWLL